MNTTSISKAALLVSLNISLYSGRKQDKDTQAEIVSAKGSGSTRAASVYKNLFTDCKELEAITKFQSKVRNRHYQLTLPWNDAGLRLLPGASLMDYKAEMTTAEGHFQYLVGEFLNKYDTLVAAAAFKLGALFDRNEYPTREHVQGRFRFDIDLMPMPTSGDFRVDIENQMLSELQQQYETRVQQQVLAAQKDAWDRLYTVLDRLKDRLTLNEDGTRRTFHATTVTNAQDLCEALTALNISKDPKLEAARKQLEDALNGVDPETLRKSDGERYTVLTNVSNIMEAFDW